MPSLEKGLLSRSQWSGTRGEEGRSVIRAPKAEQVSRWAAPGSGSGGGAPAGPDARRRGRDWHGASSSTGSFAVAASAMMGLSATGAERSSQCSDAGRGCQQRREGPISRWHCTANTLSLGLEGRVDVRQGGRGSPRPRPARPGPGGCHGRRASARVGRPPEPSPRPWPRWHRARWLCRVCRSGRGAPTGRPRGRPPGPSRCASGGVRAHRSLVAGRYREAHLLTLRGEARGTWAGKAPAVLAAVSRRQAPRPGPHGTAFAVRARGEGVVPCDDLTPCGGAPGREAPGAPQSRVDEAPGSRREGLAGALNLRLSCRCGERRGAGGR
jgi:hypothetical protein